MPLKWKYPPSLPAYVEFCWFAAKRGLGTAVGINRAIRETCRSRCRRCCFCIVRGMFVLRFSFWLLSFHPFFCLFVFPRFSCFRIRLLFSPHTHSYTYTCTHTLTHTHLSIMNPSWSLDDKTPFTPWMRNTLRTVSACVCVCVNALCLHTCFGRRRRRKKTTAKHRRKTEQSTISKLITEASVCQQSVGFFPAKENLRIQDGRRVWGRWLWKVVRMTPIFLHTEL